MRHNSIILFLLILLIGFNVKAQNRKIQFHSINSVGFLIGESGSDILLQSVNGFSYKNFYSGIGFEKDDYNYNSYPLFFDQRVYLGKSENAFVYGDLGYNFHANNKPNKDIGYYDSYNFKGGIYTDFGLGFKVKFINKSSLLFSLGHSYKELKTKIGVTPLCVGCDSYFYDYKFGYGRVIIKGGVEF
jgi:hypothetical protein